jgi:hypothetical protein
VPCATAGGAAGQSYRPSHRACTAGGGGSDYSSYSIGSESGDVVEVAGPAPGAGSVSRRRRPTCKVARLKVQKGATHPQGGGAFTPDAAKEEKRTPEGVAGDSRVTFVTPKLEEAAHGLSQTQWGIARCAGAVVALHGAAEDKLQRAHSAK